MGPDAKRSKSLRRKTERLLLAYLAASRYMGLETTSPNISSNDKGTQTMNAYKKLASFELTRRSRNSSSYVVSLFGLGAQSIRILLK